jgi:hypothetical protein
MPKRMPDRMSLGGDHDFNNNVLSYFIKSSHDLETKVSVCACQTRVETSDWARILVHNRMHGNNCRHPENIIAAPKKQ